jgi:hypothetical protein
MNFLEKLSINVNYKSSLPQDILNEYKKSNYQIKVGKIKINKKNSVKDDINSLIILNEINKKIKFENNPNQCDNFWKENIMEKIEDAIFISDYLKSKIKYSLNYELKLQWFNSDYQITGYYDIFFSSLSDILDFINQLETLIKITIFMYDKINLNKSINVIKTFFFLTEFKKKLFWNKYETIGKHHVNSGLTSYKITQDVTCCLDNHILIWRKEEMLKVYIHELIHYFKIDSKVNFSIDFNSIFCLASEVNILPNEAYTDFIAIILNSIVYSFSNKLDLKNNLINDIKFSLFQTAKILHYFKFEKWDDFQNSNCNLYLKQDSNVFPYYIIKSALLLNFDLTINLLEEITFKNTFNFNFDSTKDNINKLTIHINNSLSDSKFTDKINRLINIFKNIDVKSNKIILNTLKMTILD